jgi:2-polyprenyl-3-methyl-5-hydroxy-6-metoxy-1,4-benzoquinol methylase
LDKSPNWNDVWANIDFEKLQPLEKSLFSDLYDFALPNSPNNQEKAIEIGCFPGKFIGYLGQKGYEISGIDTHNRVSEITGWARSLNYKVGTFENTSLESFSNSSKLKYDVVTSLGFIEHFENFCDVLHQHAALCSIGGKLIIGCPNFASPLQRALHETLDNTNLSKHVLEAMYPLVWATFLKVAGFSIEFCGSLGGFGFWSETVTTNPKIAVLQNLMPQLGQFSNQLSEDLNRKESSYVALIGNKLNDTPPLNALLDFSNSCHQIALELSNRDQDLSKDYIKFITSLIK